MDIYDVVIVGAGPGGLKCAEILNNSSLKVLVLEKNPEIGHKTCAGGLTGKGIDHLNLPDEIVEFKFNRLDLHISRLSTTINHNKNFAYTIDRREFGQWQLKKLLDSPNFEIRMNARVTEISSTFITVNDEKIGYKTLVGADGSSSVVRKFVNLKSEKTILAFQYIIPTEKYDKIAFYFCQRGFHSGYSWIFPHRGYISAGVCWNSKKESAAEIKQNFIKWLNRRKITTDNARFEGFIINCDYRGYRFENVYLIGDAAGMASIYTGEGIYQALISGEEIGKQILDPGYTPDLSRIFQIQRYHEKLTDLSNSWGKARILLYYAGVILLTFSKKWRKKFIEIIG